jgi:hypothetical protein
MLREFAIQQEVSCILLLKMGLCKRAHYPSEIFGVPKGAGV